MYRRWFLILVCDLPTACTLVKPGCSPSAVTSVQQPLDSTGRRAVCWRWLCRTLSAVPSRPWPGQHSELIQYTESEDLEHAAVSLPLGAVPGRRGAVGSRGDTLR